MPIREVISILGAPRQTEQGEQTDRFVWWAPPDLAGLSVLANKNGEVVGIFASYDRRYVTKERVGPGSTEIEVRAAFGEPARIDENRGEKTFRYDWLGIWLGINDPLNRLPNRVWRVAVFRPNAGTAPRLWYIGFSLAGLPATSLAFRQAIASAVDREVITRGVATHLTRAPEAAMTIQHPRLPMPSTGARALTYNPARAKESLSQSGWTGPITIGITQTTSAFGEAFQKLLADSLGGALGIPVTFQQKADLAALLKDIKDGVLPMAILAWRADADDYGFPSFALGIAYAHFMADSELRPLIDAGDIRAVEQMLLDKVLLIPLFSN